MQLNQRSAWGALPPESPPTGWDVSKLDGICQHWFGSPKAASSHAGCDDLLRSVQRTHQAGEYNDIAYNIGVCPHGEAYELRGWNVRTGANGTTDANSRFLAVVYMAGAGDGLTDKGKAALRAVYQDAFDKGVGVKAITHGSITGSACPGPAVTKWLESGEWKPKGQVRFVVFDGEGRQLADSAAADVGWESELARLEAFDNTSRERRLRELRDDGNAVLRRVKV
jgi:hypothetical protein